MIDIESSVLVYSHFIDMRKSMNGLSILIGLDALMLIDGKAFIFLNKKRDKIKILVKENNGLVLIYKRLDEGIFKISFSSKNHFHITRRQLRSLLEGVEIKVLNVIQKPLEKHYF